jgi:hypothetical protein
VKIVRRIRMWWRGTLIPTPPNVLTHVDRYEQPFLARCLSAVGSFGAATGRGSSPEWRSRRPCGWGLRAFSGCDHPGQRIAGRPAEPGGKLPGQSARVFVVMHLGISAETPSRSSSGGFRARRS